jgi:hypothetical protein
VVAVDAEAAVAADAEVAVAADAGAAVAVDAEAAVAADAEVAVAVDVDYFENCYCFRVKHSYCLWYHGYPYYSNLLIDRDVSIRIFIYSILNRS